MFQSAKHHFISRAEGTGENILIGCLAESGACVIRDNLNRAMSLSELADIVGWSTAHFSTVFRKQASVAPMEYFTRLKVQRACAKLKMTRETIAGISASLGYDDSCYFSRLFRRHTGISPTDYRKKYTVTAR